MYKPYWLSWVVIFKALFGCLDVLILGKNPIKWRQCPNMTFAVDWDVKHQFKQTNTERLITKLLSSKFIHNYIEHVKFYVHLCMKS